MSLRVLRFAALLGLGVVGMVGFVVACTVVATNPTPHVAVLDRLSIPASWTLVDSNLVKNALLGSRIERYYFVDADPEQLVEPVNGMLVSAGLTLDVRRLSSDWCTYQRLEDRSPPLASPGNSCPPRSMDPCWENGRNGPTTCNLAATSGPDHITVDIFDRGEGMNYYIGSENYRVRAPGLVTVRVSDHY